MATIRRFRLLPLLAVLLLGTASAAEAAFTINFDTDAAGNALSAPGLFSQTTPLIELYGALGVHFSGPTANQGGAILADTSFSTQALSGSNFLAFNRSNSYSADPETIRFDLGQSAVSIFAAAGFGAAANFTMTGFDTFGAITGSVLGTASGGSYVQLSLSSSTSQISRVVLTETGNSVFVYDNLTLSNVGVPEPASMAMLGLALVGAGGVARARRRA